MDVKNLDAPPPPKTKIAPPGGGVSFFRKIDLTFLFFEILIFFK